MVPQDMINTVPVVPYGELSPQRFWKEFVSQRRPVVLDGLDAHIAELSRKWTKENLSERAGDCMLEVEFSDEGGARKYGQGMKQTMPFRRFLQSIADGEDSWYLTTQDVPTEIDGHPALYGSPLVALEGDFPRLPELAGSLVPASINLWMGLSAQGTSSGLHHDFHDNLYSLLRGRKTFRLWPPSALDSMYPHGRPVKRWPNGRVVYSEQGNIGPDGVDMDEERRWEEKVAAESELEMAEKAVEAGEQGAKRRLQAANRRLDAVMDAAMDEGSEWLDDFDAMERPAQRPTTSGAAPIPPSFSRIDADLPPAEIKKKFPRFKGFSSAITCTVEAGQTLYLPAGWWHEVTSQGAGDSKDAPGEHMALNHWFHPPDNLDAEAGFSKPYTSDFWPAVWRGRCRHAAAAPGGTANPGSEAGGDLVLLQAAGLSHGPVDHHHDHHHHHHDGKSCCSGHRAGAGYRPLKWDGPWGMGRRHHLNRFLAVAAFQAPAKRRRGL